MQKQILDALRSGNIDTALESARSYAAQAPDEADAHRLLALALRFSGDGEGSMAAIERAIALAPDDARLQLAQAGLRLGARDLDGARESLQAAIGVDPNQFAAYVMQGHLALVGNDLQEAERLVKLAERVEPGHPSLLALQGTLELRRGDADRAVALLSAANRLAPTDRTALHALGCAYLAKDHFAFAEQTFRKLLEIAPGSDSVRIMLAQLVLRQGRPADALQELEPLLADQASATPQVRRFAGELELALGRPGRGLPLLRDALAAQPGDPQILAALVGAWKRLGAVGEARDTLDAALAAAPGSDATWGARLAFENGPAAAALVADWRRQRPESLDAMDAEMILLGTDGRDEEAAAVARQLLERAPGHPRAEMCVVGDLMAREPEAALKHLDALIATAQAPADQAALGAWRALALHRSGDFPAALDAWTRRHAESLAQRLARPEASPEPASWPEAAVAAEGTPPVAFLFGLPGALADRAAQLLEPALEAFRSDRFSARAPLDAFQDPQAWARIAGGELEPASVAAGWRAALPARGIRGPVIDWLPWWDNAYAAVLRSAIPEARLLIVLRDPRDMLVDWLALGALPPLAMESPQAAAEWLATALGQLATLHEQDLVPHRLLRVDDTVDDPKAMAAQLGAALDLTLPDPPPGYFGAKRYTTGAWRDYADLLAGPFAALAPVARRFGYPDA